MIVNETGMKLSEHLINTLLTIADTGRRDHQVGVFQLDPEKGTTLGLRLVNRYPQYPAELFDIVVYGPFKTVPEAKTFMSGLGSDWVQMSQGEYETVQSKLSTT